MDAARAETIRVQEDFHSELQEKDNEMQRKLADKDAQFNAHLDSLLSNRVSVAIKDLQSKVTEQEGQIGQLQTEKRTAADEVRLAQTRARDADFALEEARKRIEHCQAELADAKDARSTLANQLNASHQRQDALLKQLEQASSEARHLQSKLDAAERSVQAAQSSQVCARPGPLPLPHRSTCLCMLHAAR